MSELLKHAIPGYGAYSLYESISSDDPFPIKVRNTVMASTTLAFHYLIFTHHGSKMMAHRIGAHSYSSHKTHGWHATRNLIKAAPVVIPVVTAVAAQAALAEEFIQPERDSTKPWWTAFSLGF